VAFHIAVDDSCKDKVFDEVQWPVGLYAVEEGKRCNARDWVFTKPPGF